jgi:hypothetical protein
MRKETPNVDRIVDKRGRRRSRAERRTRVPTLCEKRTTRGNGLGGGPWPVLEGADVATDRTVSRQEAQSLERWAARQARYLRIDVPDRVGMSAGPVRAWAFGNQARAGL